MERTYEITRRKEVLQQTVVAMGDRALELIQQGVVLQRKPDGSKVTNVDLALNQQFLETMEGVFPHDVIWGEEASNAEPNSLTGVEGRWIWRLDPIDSTSDFWRSYSTKRFTDCRSTVLAAGFAPGETAPTISAIYNPFRQQKELIVATPDGAEYTTSSGFMPQRLRVPSVDEVRRYEHSGQWGDIGPKLKAFMPHAYPYARRIVHSLRMGSVALGDVDLSVFSAPSNPHDVAAGAHAVHRAGGTVRTLKGEQYEDVDWRISPVNGVVAAASPYIADQFLEKAAA